MLKRFSIMMLVTCPLWLASCLSNNTPMSTINTVTDWGHDINRLYFITTVITGFIFFAVALPLIYVVYRFRERPGDTRIPEQVHGNTTLEFAWTMIPVVLLIFIAVPTWQVIFKEARRVREPSADVFRVTAVGHQWWWEFQYPELGIKTAGELHLPEDREILLTITSADVIHSFWVPRFGGKVDAIPGVENHLALSSPKVSDSAKAGGDYYQGQCVELCGASHAKMRFQAVVHTADEFGRWAKAHNTPPEVETKKEQEGQEMLTTKGCIACHTVYGTAAAGNVGPDLSSFGSRQTLAGAWLTNTPENLATWLKDPASVKPGSLMPTLGLNDAEVASLSAFLRNSTAKRF